MVERHANLYLYLWLSRCKHVVSEYVSLISHPTLDMTCSMLISLRILRCLLRVSWAIFWARWNPWGCWCGSFIIRTHQLRRSRLSLPAGLQRCDRALSWELRKLLRASLMICTMMIRWMVAKSWIGGKHPTIYRVSTILLVVQDFATIHCITYTIVHLYQRSWCKPTVSHSKIVLRFLGFTLW